MIDSSYTEFGGAIWLATASYGSLSTLSNAVGAMSSLPTEWLDTPAHCLEETTVRLLMLRHISRQILAGLSHMHSNGWTHCDLKMSNILINEKLELRIADFGHCSPTSELPGGYLGSDGIIHVRDCFGTWFCRAPEVCALPMRLSNEQPLLLSEQLDIWSFGIIVHQLAAGEARLPCFLDRCLQRHMLCIAECPHHPLHVGAGAEKRVQETLELMSLHAQGDLLETTPPVMRSRSVPGNATFHHDASGDSSRSNYTSAGACAPCCDSFNLAVLRFLPADFSHLFRLCFQP
ncbi:MAG: hypothetical protein MHM6MM_000063 [Cercozoa sp. M6MM]